MVWILLAAALGAAPCPPRALLDGDPEIVGRVSEDLTARGVDLTSGEDGCPAVRARLAAAGLGVGVELRDGGGRSASHVVSVPALAATLVESWARPDLASSLLAPPSMPARPAPAAPAAAAPGRWLVPSAQGEISVGSDGAVAPGLRVSASLAGSRLWPFAVLRLAVAPRVAATGLPLASRRSADLLVGLRLPFALGGLRLSPGAALGVGAVDTVRAGDGCDGTCDRPHVEDGEHGLGVGPRGELSLSAALPLSGSLAAEIGLAALLAPLARTGALVPSYARPAGARAGRLALAPEPTWTLGAALGVTWGS